MVRTQGQEIRSCATCAKKASEKRCAVLSVMIGRDRPCWCWSDNPQWEVLAETATKAYALLKSAG